ncbi:hypothetical protein OS493_040184 [Desmophyllum pertusum]|uniref:Uncharacterized protein n=1 Tax=Desmophyllum pertusum TaxID=174260 RepID=A0A9X0CC12_9CNID|nr:hypothetical protein OS493_040184 [Desmophyllum pertusum]
MDIDDNKPANQSSNKLSSKRKRDSETSGSNSLVLRGFLGGHRCCWELNQLNRGILQTFKSRVSTKRKTERSRLLCGLKIQILILAALASDKTRVGGVFQSRGLN